MEPALFLVFIDDLPYGVLSRIGIYADGTTLYSSLNKFVFVFENVKSGGELESDLCSIVEWGDRWLVTFDATQTKCTSELADLVPIKHFTVRSARFSEQINRDTVNSPMRRTKFYQPNFFPRPLELFH